MISHKLLFNQNMSKKSPTKQNKSKKKKRKPAPTKQSEGTAKQSYSKKNTKEGTIRK